MLKERRHRADRRLVAGDDRNHSFDLIRGEVRRSRVVHELSSDERKAHFWSAVELPIGHANGEGRRNEPVCSVVLFDSTRHGSLHGVHLFLDSQVTLAVAQVAEYGPHGSVDLSDILTQEVGSADALHVTSGVRKSRTGGSAHVHS